MSEWQDAYQDVQDVIAETGNTITILTNTESQTQRDKYTSIINRPNNSFSILSFPIRFDPSDKELQKCGIQNKVDVIFYISIKDLEEMGKSAASIDEIRHTVEYLGITYKIKQVSSYSQFNGIFLYVILGCLRN